MKMMWIAVAAIAGLLGVGLANAQANPEELAKKNMCLSCHSVDKKVVGPAYKEVAAKYKGDQTAEAKLIEKVKRGGSGVWGPVPMPPNSWVPDSDINALVSWILTLKK
jgi:cytochrome c